MLALWHFQWTTKSLSVRKVAGEGLLFLVAVMLKTLGDGSKTVRDMVKLFC